ncbi:MAG: dihydropteroate synthase [Coxiellaceae bacterium]|nr:dihydropteroate synthase [Coxiellaceae bacterium]
MGVINASPNSFYNPIDDVDAALKQAESMVLSGASIIDVGGEATNPNVHIERDGPSIQQEMDRVTPVIEAIKKHYDVLVSVDTSQAAVMRAAVEAGADMINDQRALREENALETAAALSVPVCLMHFFNEPRKPGSSSPASLLQQIKQELSDAVLRCEQAGIPREKLIIDPGFGQGNYGKNCLENYYLLEKLDAFHTLGLPILVGWSRKSMIGDVLNAPAEGRLYGSIAAAVIAAMKGAAVIRVHDVKATVDAVKVFQAMRRCESLDCIVAGSA